MGNMSFGKLTRLCNQTSVYRDQERGIDLKWIVTHEGVEYGSRQHDGNWLGV